MVAAANKPLPFPNRIPTLLLPKLVTARSALPSPLKSPVVTPVGLEPPELKVVAAAKRAAAVGQEDAYVVAAVVGHIAGAHHRSAEVDRQRGSSGGERAPAGKGVVLVTVGGTVTPDRSITALLATGLPQLMLTTETGGTPATPAQVRASLTAANKSVSLLLLASNRTMFAPGARTWTHSTGSNRGRRAKRSPRLRVCPRNGVPTQLGPPQPT